MYIVLLHLFTVINCNRCLYKQHWYLYRSFCTLQAKKLVTRSKTFINIKQVPRYKETDQDNHNYQDNRVSISALMIITVIEPIPVCSLVMTLKGFYFIKTCNSSNVITYEPIQQSST